MAPLRKMPKARNRSSHARRARHGCASQLSSFILKLHFGVALLSSWGCLYRCLSSFYWSSSSATPQTSETWSQMTAPSSRKESFKGELTYLPWQTRCERAHKLVAPHTIPWMFRNIIQTWILIHTNEYTHIYHTYMNIFKRADFLKIHKIDH
jgi:hypothetical protein